MFIVYISVHRVQQKNSKKNLIFLSQREGLIPFTSISEKGKSNTFPKRTSHYRTSCIFGTNTVFMQRATKRTTWYEYSSYSYCLIWQSGL